MRCRCLTVSKIHDIRFNTMKYFQIINRTLTIGLVSLLFPFVALAVSSVYEEAPSIYVLHLYYKNGVISLAPNYPMQYEILYQGESAPSSAPNGAYKLDVSSIRGASLATISFDPPAGSSLGGASYFDVQAPYFADAKEVVVSTAAGKMVLSVDVSGSSYCNDDGKCDFLVGEDPLSCPNDCRGTISPSEGGGKVVSPTPAATTPSGTATPVIVPPSQPSTPPSDVSVPPPTLASSSMSHVIWAILAVLLVLFAIFGIFWYRKRRSSQSLPTE